MPTRHKVIVTNVAPIPVMWMHQSTKDKSMAVGPSGGQATEIEITGDLFEGGRVSFAIFVDDRFIATAKHMGWPSRPNELIGKTIDLEELYDPEDAEANSPKSKLARITNIYLW